MNDLPILVAVPLHQPHYESLLRMPGVRVEVIPYLETSREVPVDVLRGKEVFFFSLPPSNFDDAKDVRWVQVDSAGYNQLFPLNLPAKGIRATNGLGNFDVPIAEWNIAMMVNLARDLRGMIRNQERGVWERDKRFQREIRGMVVGLWGYGGIARETARLAKTMGLKVHVLCRSGVRERANIYRVPGTGDPEGRLPDKVFSMEQKREFLQSLDFLVLSLPLTKVTEGIVGEAELQALPRPAFVLNPARGPLIQEKALLRALREGWIAGAAIDTHYQYPMPSDHPLWSFPNVMMTPHISGSSDSPFFLERIWDIFVQNVERYRNRKPMLNVLTEAQLRGE